MLPSRPAGAGIPHATGHTSAQRLVFLPGAGGRRDFWAPAAGCLPGHDSLLLGWPGFGNEPPDPRIRSLAGLPPFVRERLDGPAWIVAQSMGGVVALLLALEHPDLVRGLVLCATSGGIDLRRFDTEDWREAYARDYLPAFEHAPTWFVDDRTDLTYRLPSLDIPVLLIWGADDRTVPPAVGEHFARLLPDARLVTLPGGSHAVAQEQPDAVAGHIAEFLAAGVES